MTVELTENERRLLCAFAKKQAQALMFDFFDPDPLNDQAKKRAVRQCKRTIWEKIARKLQK